MTEKTLTWVAPDLNEWPNPKRNNTVTYYVNVAFADGDQGSVGKESRDVALHLQELLTALVDQPAEFELEDRGKKTQDGDHVKWTIKGFPGYELAGAGDGGGEKQRTWAEAYRNTEAGFRAEQDFMNRRTALMQAVATPGPVSVVPAGVLTVADSYYAWLTKDSAASVTAPGEKTDGAVSGIPTSTAADEPEGGASGSGDTGPAPGSTISASEVSDGASAHNASASDGRDHATPEQWDRLLAIVGSETKVLPIAAKVLGRSMSKTALASLTSADIAKVIEGAMA